MANKLYIKEFESLPNIGTNPAQLWGEPCSVEQTPVGLSSTHAESSAFGSKTRYICITSDVDTAYLISTAGSSAVTGTHFPLWSKNYLCIAVRPGDIISGVLWT